jgi:hypothetical protein
LVVRAAPLAQDWKHYTSNANFMNFSFIPAFKLFHLPRILWHNSSWVRSIRALAGILLLYRTKKGMYEQRLSGQYP